MKKLILSLVLLVLYLANGWCYTNLSVHCAEDNNLIEKIITNLRNFPGNRGDKIAEAALKLIGASKDDYYYTDSVGTLRTNIHSFTPLMLVNTSIALQRSSEKQRGTEISSFQENLENLSCRRGENRGYPSLMFHTSDWIIDNISRGNVKELTENYSGVVAKTKSLDEMTRNRKNYAALSDSAVFEAVRMTEMGFRTHRIPQLKKETIKKKEILDDLQNGDIIIMVPNRDGIDFYDIGIVIKREDGPHLIHVSPQTGKVEETADDLTRYFPLMTKYFQGYRILRPTE